MRYLNEIGIIKIVDSERDIDLEDKPKSKKKRKGKDKYKYAPPKEGRGKKYSKKCPICGREFISYKNKDGILCSKCVLKYSFFEKKALEGIISGKFDKNLLSNILLFREEGASDSDIAKRLDIEHDFLIKPLINFLSDDDLLYAISENLSNRESPEIESGDNSVEVSDSNVSIEKRICPVCQREFIPNAKNQLYCKECRHKYDNFELQVLSGINKGIYTEEMALEIKKLLNQGYSKSSVCNKFNIKNTIIINLILEFLLDEDLSLEEEIPVEEIDQDIGKVCPICKKTFIPRANQKYCNDCKSKFTPLELGILFDIEQGKYTEETAIQIAKLKQEGNSNQQISNKMKLSHPNVITPILNFLLKDADLSDKEANSNSKVKICPICENEFTPKSRNGLDLCCPECRAKYKQTEIKVLVGVKEGKYSEDLANKILKLKNTGFSKKYISEKYDIPVTLINPILKYFKDNRDVYEGITFYSNLSKWFVRVKDNEKTINLGFYDTIENAILARDNYYNSNNQSKKESEDKLLKQLYKKDCGNNYSKIILKGIISDKDRVSIFNFISYINSNLNKLLCEKQEDNTYNFLLDVDIEKSRLKAALKDLKYLGWENAK